MAMKRALFFGLLALVAALFAVEMQASAQSVLSHAATVREPSVIVREAQRRWRADLATGALADQKTRFPSPRFGVLAARLGVAERRYGFSHLLVAMFHPRQIAPLVLVRATNKQAFARNVPAILRLIDPKRNTGDDRTGWAYEGFFLKAVDQKGTPFLIVFNHFRGPHAGGGQWASRKAFLPFPHG
jgi:hypothetical protein